MGGLVCAAAGVAANASPLPPLPSLPPLPPFLCGVATAAIDAAKWGANCAAIDDTLLGFDMGFDTPELEEVEPTPDTQAALRIRAAPMRRTR